MVTTSSRTDVIERELFQARLRMQSAHQVFSERSQEFQRLRDILVERGEWEDFCRKHGWSPEATPADHCV